MSGRKFERDIEEQRKLGHAVRVGRRGGVPWKVLEGVYGRTRVQLWRYLRLAEDQFSAAAQEKSSR